MDDAGALLAADAAQTGDVMQQCVDEGTSGVADRGMDDHAGRFVHDHQVRVVVEDGERKRLGDRGRGYWRRDRQVDDVTDVHGMARPDLLLVQADVAVTDETLDL